MRHDPHDVAALAAMLLAGRHDAEPHHIRSAIAAARAILDEAGAGAEEAAATDEAGAAGAEKAAVTELPKPARPVKASVAS